MSSSTVNDIQIYAQRIDTAYYDHGLTPREIATRWDIDLDAVIELIQRDTAILIEADLPDIVIQKEDRYAHLESLSLEDLIEEIDPAEVRNLFMDEEPSARTLQAKLQKALEVAQAVAQAT